jgi:molybdate transport system substrate-binding protein
MAAWPEPAATLVISSASTGVLYAQLQRGGPYDLFLAADQKRPQLLEKSGKIQPGSRFTYALGRLVVWSKFHPLPDDRAGIRQTLLSSRKISIANPDIAPYGRAALQVLQQLGILEQVRPKLVRGNNVAQSYQFVDSGSADIGIIARALVHNPRAGHPPDHEPPNPSGHRWAIPDDLHGPIVQQAVILIPGGQRQSVQTFHQFLRSNLARKLIQQQGYQVPQP